MLRIEHEVLAVASIGASIVAPTITKGIERPEPALAGVLVGVPGSALGTYAGFSVTELLQ